MGLFGRPKMPAREPPAPMPDPANRDRAANREIAQQVARSGRRSTILTGGQRETLGA